MTRKALWLAAIVVLVSNAAALGFAWMNRAGEPEAVLELTEREVRLLPRDDDNTAIGLRLEWIDSVGSARRVAAGSTPAKLASVGFDCTAPLTRENDSVLPRAGASRGVRRVRVRRRELAALPRVDHVGVRSAGGRAAAPTWCSIDVGLDAGALRARHPNRRAGAHHPRHRRTRLRGGARTGAGRLRPSECRLPDRTDRADAPSRRRRCSPCRTRGSNRPARAVARRSAARAHPATRSR